MNKFTQPTKEQVRQYMEARRARQAPLPSIKEIQRQLGWQLVELMKQDIQYVY